MKKALCLLASALLLLSWSTQPARAEGASANGSTAGNLWYLDERARITVANPTPMEGKFFTTLWGGSSSDLDAQELLHAYLPVRWDGGLGRFRFDHSVVEEVLITDDDDGNRSYLMVLTDDLYYSDGTRITAKDYAFSMLLQMDPVIAETGGQPKDYSWLLGADEYLGGKAKAPAGLRIIADNLLQVTVRAEALPYFYEPAWLAVYPFPIAEIAPETEVMDDGDGAYLSQPLTADGLQQTVLDNRKGYLSHPGTVSGPYTLKSFDGTTATFDINPLYKGAENGMVPRIGEIVYTRAENADMVSRLRAGDFDLLDKVTRADTIAEGIRLIQSEPGAFSMDNEIRSGLSMLWFTESSPAVQETAVRQAIAHCFDRDGFISESVGSYGLKTDGFYGLGQWMYRIASGTADPPPSQEQADDDNGMREWEGISLDGMTLYAFDTEEANRLLNEAGWTLNQDGESFESGRDTVRYKKIGEELTGLNLTMAIPESAETRETLKTYLKAPLQEAGIELTMRAVDMETVRELYEGKAGTGFDLVYLGEDFSVLFDPEILAPRTEGTELGTVKQELYELAREMVNTEPEDLAGFIRKWVTLQERITETLPLLPVYSNVYFDFFSRKLHNYSVTGTLTWSGAIISSFVSDMEILNEEEQEHIQEQLNGTDGLP